MPVKNSGAGANQTQFKSRVAVNDAGCWIWQGHVGQVGYGVLKWNGKFVRAHRRAFELFVGVIPLGVLVCHSCDVKTCVNPNHLFLGSPHDNTRDAANKGLMKGPRKLSETDVLAIRSSNKTTKELADEYDMSDCNIRKVRNRTIFRHL